MYDYEYFACVCGEESKAEAEWHLKQAYHTLGDGTDESNLLTRVIYSLTWDLKEPVSITAIDCDMWAGIWAETDAKKDDGTPLFKVKIQCDLLEHGIAVLWNAFHDKFPLED